MMLLCTEEVGAEQVLGWPAGKPGVAGRVAVAVRVDSFID